MSRQHGLLVWSTRPATCSWFGIECEGGSAILVLEEVASAVRRGASIIAEMVGFSESFDAHSMMSLAPDGVAIERMIRECLRDSGVANIQYVNAHGTGTDLNDSIEAEVIQRTLGSKVLVNSTKSLMGHTLGASGAIEAAITARSVSKEVVHPSKNIDEPIADLDFVREKKSAQITTALSQSFAFGGHNAAIAIRRFDC